jgi:hypothetical protein
LRFCASREVRGDDECWPWIGHIDKEGYGYLHQGKSRFGAHRLAWEFAHGSIPDGMVMLHAACDNRRCVNPAHLRPGAIADNNEDMVAKRRHVFGERSSQAKLTDQKALEIRRRRLAGEAARHLAAEFGVSDSLVCRIAKGRRWSHLSFGASAR